MYGRHQAAMRAAHGDVDRPQHRQSEVPPNQREEEEPVEEEVVEDYETEAEYYETPDENMTDDDIDALAKNIAENLRARRAAKRQAQNPPTPVAVVDPLQVGAQTPQQIGIQSPPQLGSSRGPYQSPQYVPQYVQPANVYQDPISVQSELIQEIEQMEEYPPLPEPERQNTTASVEHPPDGVRRVVRKIRRN